MPALQGQDICLRGKFPYASKSIHLPGAWHFVKAAQEAGFRPCLRCRPETAPDMGAWRGTSNTVSRGLALIELGALDESDVEGLATRLGLPALSIGRTERQ